MIKLYCIYIVSVLQGGHLKNPYKLLNLRAYKFHLNVEYVSLNASGRYFVWNFIGYLWNSIQSILPIHWKSHFMQRW